VGRPSSCSRKRAKRDRRKRRRRLANTRGEGTRFVEKNVGVAGGILPGQKGGGEGGNPSRGRNELGWDEKKNPNNAERRES